MIRVGLENYGISSSTAKRLGKRRKNKNTEAILGAQEDSWKRRENENQKAKDQLKKILKNKEIQNG